MNMYDASKMTSRQFARALAENTRIIVPVASFEVLGTHGPLGADYLVANAVTPMVAERAHALYVPTVPYGDTLELPQEAGNVSVPTDVLAGYYQALADSLLRNNPKAQLFFLNFHSLNNRALDAVSRQLANDGYRTCMIDWWRTVGMGSADLLHDVKWGTGHGGEMITSVLMHLCPDAVQLEEQTNTDPKPRFSFFKDHLAWSATPFVAYGTFDDYTAGSSWGDISHASAEKGSTLVERAIEAIVSFMDEAAILAT